MKKAEPLNDEPRDEYDFVHGTRGKYAERVAVGSNVVVLEPDVAAEFKTADEVNRTLREAAERRRRAGRA